LSLFEELKRRNVFKVTIAYIVMAWLVMQVADVILNNITAPGWIFQVLLLFIAIGLPIAVFFAWAFELTSEGLKREQDIDGDSMSGMPESRGIKKYLPVVAVAVLITFGATAWWVLQLASNSEAELSSNSNQGTAQSVSAIGITPASGPRVAVLPFKNLSNDQEQKYFSDGLTEDIITALSQTDLFVLGFSPSLNNFSDMAISEIGENLGVRYLLKGSVRRDADQIRVSGQLFDAKSGEQLWGESYTRDLTAANIFALQDDITARVVGTIADASGIIARVSMEELEHNPTKELAAYECVLRSYTYEAMHTAEAHLKARNCVERAVELDPTYAEALATAAYLYREEHFHEFNERPHALQNAMSSARKAIEIEPLNQNAHYALAFIYFDSGVPKLGEFFVTAKRAVELNPNNSRVIGGMGALIAFAGEWEWGIDLLEKTMSINPYSHMRGWLHFVKATDYFQQGDYHAASTEIDKVPYQFPAATINRIAIHAELGNQKKAVSELNEALSSDPLFLEEARMQLGHFYPGNENLHGQLIESLIKTQSWVE